MSENVLENIIKKKIEKIDNLKKSIGLKKLDELIQKNKSYINFKDYKPYFLSKSYSYEEKTFNENGTKLISFNKNS